MSKKDNKELRELLERLNKVSYVRPEELPDIDLYMDQVTTFMDQHLESSKRYPEDKLLTKTMINNYTKNDLLPSPDKKKYSKEHMYLLILIYYMKNVLSITDIQAILKPLNERFFGGAGEVSLDAIYAEILGIQKVQTDAVAKDVIRKYTASQRAFENVGDEGQQDFLRRLSLICLLSFDISMKRQLIEQMIDTEFAPLAAKEKGKAEKEKKPEKGKAEKKKGEKQDKKKETGEQKEKTE